MSKTTITQRIAFKAVIVNDKQQVLVLREAQTYHEGTQVGRYGLPGGRLEPGEAWSDGLLREVHEETGLEIVISHPLYVGEWRPLIQGIPHQIIAVFMQCQYQSGSVVLSEEHDAYKWVGVDQWQQISMMRPDDEVLRTYFDNSTE